MPDDTTPAICGDRCDTHPETVCTEPPRHRMPHGGPLIINGRHCGGAAWGSDHGYADGTPGRTKTGPTIASEQISVAATTDTMRDNSPACDVLRMRLARVLDECRSTYIPGDQAALVLAELAPELAELLDYRNRITWETTCGGCARMLDSSYAETVRREEAERHLATVRAAHDAVVGQLAAAETRAAAVTRVQREIARLTQLPTVADVDAQADSFATGARWAIRQIHDALTGQGTP